MNLDFTHNPNARSWLDSANVRGSDFPIQNLPHGVFRRRGSSESYRGGVAIGDQVLDLARLSTVGVLDDQAQQACESAALAELNGFMGMGRPAWRALRYALFRLLNQDAGDQVASLVRPCLVPLEAVEMKLPVQVRNYTDFYTSVYHAENVGRVIRPDHPLTPNFKWLPIAYHGRASSVVVSGTPFHRPRGQSRAPGTPWPQFGPCMRLDFELEMGFFIGPGTDLGQSVSLSQAPEHLFGMCLLNDWSARDHQFWEMDPLGPFSGKNFCTSISPWVVTMEALAPYRVPLERSATDPAPLAYLNDADDQRQGSLDIHLETWIETSQHRMAHLSGDRVMATNFRHQYWTIGQMLTQHTAGGCNLQCGDLMGTGTISGPSAGEAGAMVELSLGGARDVPLPSTGEQRRFLEDGDCVILRGHCEKPGFARIGFGECRGTVLATLPPEGL